MLKGDGDGNGSVVLFVSYGEGFGFFEVAAEQIDGDREFQGCAELGYGSLPDARMAVEEARDRFLDFFLNCFAIAEIGRRVVKASGNEGEQRSEELRAQLLERFPYLLR